MRCSIKIEYTMLRKSIVCFIINVFFLLGTLSKLGKRESQDPLAELNDASLKSPACSEQAFCAKHLELCTISETGLNYVVDQDSIVI
jgi:hypothetical protein